MMVRRIVQVVQKVVQPIVPLVVALGIALPAAAGDGSGTQGTSTSAPSSRGDHGHFFFYLAPLRAVRDDGSFLPGFHPGAGTRWVHLGGGGEGDLTDRFGIGTDFGGIPGVMNTGTIGVISANAYYHAIGRKHPLDPYLTGGVTGVFSESHQKTGGPNLGAGVNVWSRGAFGASVELRRTFGAPYTELRVGVMIRQ